MPRQKESYSSFIDFKPEKHIDFAADRPIYHLIDGELRYSPNGKVNLSNKLIWRFDPAQDYIWTFVSPDTRFIVVCFEPKKRNYDLPDEYQLLVLSNEGDLLFQKEISDNEETGVFRLRDIFWSADSSSFFVLSFLKKIYPFQNTQENQSILYRFDVNTQNLEKFVDFNFNINHRIYISRDNQYLYFSPLYSSDNYYKVDLSYVQHYSISISKIIEEKGSKIYDFEGINCKIEPYKGEDAYAYYTYYQYGRNDDIIPSYDFKKTLYKDYDGLYLIEDGKAEILLKSKNELILADSCPDIPLGNGYFLPGNRFYLLEGFFSQEYTGILLIDTELKKLSKLNFKNLEIYFSLTSDDTDEEEGYKWCKETQNFLVSHSFENIFPIYPFL